MEGSTKTSRSDGLVTRNTGNIEEYVINLKLTLITHNIFRYIC